MKQKKTLTKEEKIQFVKNIMGPNTPHTEHQFLNLYKIFTRPKR